MIGLLFLGATVISPVAAVADREVLYVDVSGVGPGDGSMEDPFVSIGQALLMTPAEIRIAEGSYGESVVVYPDLILRGGYASGSWFRDPVEHPTIITGQGEAAVSGSGDLGELEITGLSITGIPGITRYGINLDSVSGTILIGRNLIFDLQAPSGIDGEDCSSTPECDFHGSSGMAAFGIICSGTNVIIAENTVHHIYGGSGGNGGQWDYAAGHTDGGDGGHGAAAFGIYGKGSLSCNIVYAVFSGNGGHGAGGFDDTGYGGDGGLGGTGGWATGIYAGTGENHLFSNLVFDITAGAGGNGGSGTWWASPADGGDAGFCAGVMLSSVGPNFALLTTVDSLNVLDGGDGGHSIPYSGPVLNPGADGGDGGECRGIYLASTVGQAIINHNVVTNTTVAPGGTGGSGTTPGADGADGTAYGLYEYSISRTILSTYNCLWNHGTGNYYNVSAGTGDISQDPVYVTGDFGDYYLSQIAAGQATDSPCVDAGGHILFYATTRTDNFPDEDLEDLGYHYPIPCINHGDVNGSGDITAEDAQITFAIALGSYTPTTEEACAADCNGDDNITAGDAQATFFAVMGAGECVNALI